MEGLYTIKLAGCGKGATVKLAVVEQPFAVVTVTLVVPGTKPAAVLLLTVVTVDGKGLQFTV